MADVRAVPRALAVGRGETADARRWAEEAIARGKTDRVCAGPAGGDAPWVLRASWPASPGLRAEALRWVWAHTEREGRRPGVFPAAPDLVEALVDLGELVEATAVARRLAELADAQAHPWGLATARRSHAVIRLAESYDDGVVEELEDVAREYAAWSFDSTPRARCSRSAAACVGTGRGAARRTLLAADAFDELGSHGWAVLTRSDVERSVPAGRRPRAPEPGGATRGGARGGGLANKEIAQALVVTVSTVEYHLSKTYAKLGIRSRAQLAARRVRGAEPGTRGVDPKDWGFPISARRGAAYRRLHGRVHRRAVRLSDGDAAGRHELRAREAAAALTAEGTNVRFLRSIYLPEDETCFFLYRASSMERSTAARRAQLAHEHVAVTARTRPHLTTTRRFLMKRSIPLYALVAALAMAGALCVSHPAQAGPAEPPVPTAIAVPDGHTAVADAVGVQIHSCDSVGTGFRRRLSRRAQTCSTTSASSSRPTSAVRRGRRGTGARSSARSSSG